MEIWIAYIFVALVLIMLGLLGVWAVVLDIRSSCRIMKFRQDLAPSERIIQLGHTPAGKRAQQEANRKASSDRMKAFWAEVKKKG